MKKFVIPLLLCVLLSMTFLTADALTIGPASNILSTRAELVKSGLVGQSVPFSLADFRQALGVYHIPEVTVVSLPDPTQGTLKLMNLRVSAGQTIDADQVHLLTFTPAADFVTEANFTFTCGEWGGGAVLPCSIHLLEAINEGPRAGGAAQSVWTQEGIAVQGRLEGEDPEGDALCFQILTSPAKGCLQLTDEATGEFRYTPRDGYTGKDSFRYVVRDQWGNYSKEATVSIAVDSRSLSWEYRDMEGHRAANASLVLAAQGILLGELEGDGMYFRPDGTLTRGEFVVMAMKAAGITPGAVQTTWFDDNDSIPASMRPYIATAQRRGYVHGSFDGTGLYFHADRAITRGEAAVVLANILQMEESTTLPAWAAGESIPVWARGAVATLCEAGVYTQNGDGLCAVNDSLTRADGAEMLLRVLRLR